VATQSASAQSLIGIARLAAESDLLEAKRRVEYRELETRKLVSRTANARMPFRWTVNPYRGCEFGCKYCYARYTHEFLELRATEDFERKIFAKVWAQAGLREELGKIPKREPVAIGTATDPYQPAERRYLLTRKLLEVLAEEKGRHFSLVTKSDLVRRDLDLLETISKRNVLEIGITVTTVNEELARKLERSAPRPSLRLGAMAALAGKGIAVTAMANPLMPWLTDSEESLEALGQAVAASGARGLTGQMLFLKPCAQRSFFPLLEEQFPELVARYRRLYAGGAFLRGAYREDAEARLERVRNRHNLQLTWAGYRPEEWEDEPQLSLFE
jgi:DNA repair photolyase